MAAIHVCVSPVVKWEIRHFKCQNCGKRRFLVEEYEWYAPNMACLNCGDEYSEGGRKERPFMRGWREKAVKRLAKRVEYLRSLSL